MKKAILTFLLLAFSVTTYAQNSTDDILKQTLDNLGRSVENKKLTVQEPEPEARNPIPGSQLLKDSFKDDKPQVATELIEAQPDIEPVSEINMVLDILEAKDMDIKDVLKLIMVKSGLNIIAGSNIEGRVTIYLKEINVLDALRIVLDTNKLAYSEENGIYRIMTADEFETKFGYPFGQMIQTKIINLSHAEAADLAPILEQIKGESGKVIFSELNNNLILIDEPEKVMTMTSLIAELDVPLVTESISLTHAQASDVAKQIQQDLTVNMENVNIDNASNSIVITDTQKNINTIKQFIQNLDQTEKEIQLSTKTIQIILDEEYPKGVDWEAIVSNYQKLKFENGEDVNRDGELKLGTLTAEDFLVLLEALDTVGAVYNVKENELTSSEQQTTSVSIKSLNMNLYAQEEAEESSLEGSEEAKYNIVPFLTTDQQFVINFKPDFFLKNAGKREKEISIELENGSTIVVGGLFKAVKVDKKRKIPLLGDLPLLGFAFRSERERIAKAEIIVFITAQLVDKE